jgi:hypothetical protein
LRKARTDCDVRIGVGISPNEPYDARWDLSGDDRINGSDLLKVAPFIGKKCA